MDKNEILALKFYYENTSETDPGITEKTIDVLNAVLKDIEEKEAATKRKRKSPNRSGIVQIDPETGKIVAEYATQKEALEAIGKAGKSGLGDAINGRSKTHLSYGYRWYFKDELSDATKAGHLK